MHHEDNNNSVETESFVVDEYEQDSNYRRTRMKFRSRSSMAEDGIVPTHEEKAVSLHEALQAKSKNESKGQEDKIVVPLPVVVPPPPEGPEEQKSDALEKPEV